jgi:hypothetical protein
MANINPFSVFTTAEISAAINVVPNTYGRINELNLMPVRGVTMPDIALEEQNGSLALIPTEQYGGPGTVGRVGKRKVRTFRIPKLVHDEAVSPQEVQGIRAFGTNEQAGLAALLNQRLTTARGKHDITLEYHRMGALQGVIMDADGSTPIYNLFTEFGITEKSVDFVLGTAGTEIRDKCMEVVRHVEDNLLGDVMQRVHALVSPEFFDKLVRHAKVKEAFANYQEAAQRIGGDMRKGFTFGGITFEEYRGAATNTAGTSTKFITANDGRAFPVGTTQTFATFAGPADFNEAVGTIGQLYYAKTLEAKFGRGYEIHTQSNPLPMCMRPAVLVKLTTSN